jgi:hypothetical protein
MLPQISSKPLENNPPYIPNNPNPSNNSTNVNINPILNWTGGDPDGNNVTYNVYFDTANPPIILVSENQTNTTYSPITLQYETQYFWKIISWDNNSAYSEGPIWNFITIQEPNNPPNQPSNPNPANGTTGVGINYNISWTGGDPDGDNVTYNVYFDTANPPITLVSENQTATSYDPGTLNTGITYYWKIVAYDIFNASSAGPIWSFTTITNNPPYQPSNATPKDGSTNVEINTDLKWEGGDPDGDPVTYDVYFGTINPPPLIASNHTVTVYDPGKMNYSTTYYWQIVAWDYLGASTEGAIWHFTTGEKTNNEPNRPFTDSIIGLILSGKPYEFNISSTDPDGDDIFYYVDWADGTYESWFGPYPEGEIVVVNHTWPAKTMLYQVKIKAKDIYGAESEWGTFFVFVIGIKSTGSSRFARVLSAFLHRFTIFERILTFFPRINRALS